MQCTRCKTYCSDGVEGSVSNDGWLCDNCTPASEKPDIAEVLHTILENQTYLLEHAGLGRHTGETDVLVEKSKELLKRIAE